MTHAQRMARAQGKRTALLSFLASGEVWTIADVAAQVMGVSRRRTLDALAAMEAGDLDVTVFQNAAGQGGGAVDTALKLARGEATEQKVFVPFELVTPANLADYK